MSKKSNSTKNTWTLVFVFLILMLIFLCYCNVNEHFTEHFGSTCIDFIPFKNPIKKTKKPNQIFVSVASYRDDECQQTLKSIFSQADHPFNIIVGVCQQNKESDEQCELGLDPKYKKQVKDISMDYMKAKGPTYARYWCSTLWDGEEFFLQIDSHTHFNKHWDSDLIRMFRQCQDDSKKPILTVYPPTQKQMEISGSPEMCNGKLSNDKIPIFLAGWTSKAEISYNGTDKPTNKPKRCPKPFAAGGFMFLSGDFLDEVPYDPNLSHLFQGEETLLSARLWTHGYDFYTPNIKTCWHHYGRPEKPKYWTDHKNSAGCRRKAEKRVLFMLEIGDKQSVAEEFLRDIHQYGFGKVRKLKDYWLAAGIDFDKKGDSGIFDDCNDKENPDPKFKEWNFKKHGFKKIRKF
jgi:hypothetical protein